MIIDIDKVKIPWLGRGRLVENFADCWAGGGDCRASGQDKAADAGDDECELHRYVPVAELANYSIFRAWKSSVVSQDSIFGMRPTDRASRQARSTSDLSAKGSERQMLDTNAGGVREERRP